MIIVNRKIFHGRFLLKSLRNHQDDPSRKGDQLRRHCPLPGYRFISQGGRMGFESFARKGAVRSGAPGSEQKRTPDWEGSFSSHFCHAGVAGKRGIKVEDDAVVDFATHFWDPMKELE